MRSPWMYRLGAFLLFFAGGLATWIDATLSKGWIENVTQADKTMPGLSMGMAFILATLANAFGAIATNSESWKFLYIKSKELAAIADPHERMLVIIGNGVVSLIVLVGFVFVYGTDIVSTQASVGNFWLAVSIVFGSDLCFMLAVPLWLMSKSAARAIARHEAGMYNDSEPRTVNAKGRRFG